MLDASAHPTTLVTFNDCSKILIARFAALLAVWPANMAGRAADWENPSVIGINKRAAHAPLRSFSSPSQAADHYRLRSGSPACCRWLLAAGGMLLEGRRHHRCIARNHPLPLRPLTASKPPPPAVAVQGVPACPHPCKLQMRLQAPASCLSMATAGTSSCLSDQRPCRMAFRRQTLMPPLGRRQGSLVPDPHQLLALAGWHATSVLLPDIACQLLRVYRCSQHSLSLHTCRLPAVSPCQLSAIFPSVPLRRL